MLRQRVRVGRLDPARLALGAALGDPAAAYAHGTAPPSPTVQALLAHSDFEVRVRTWLGVGKIVFDRQRAPRQEGVLGSFGLRLLARVAEVDGGGGPEPLELAPQGLAWWALYDAAPVQVGPVLALQLEDWFEQQAEDWFEQQADGGSIAGGRSSEYAERLLLGREPSVRQELVALLLPWALQRSDPLLDWLHTTACPPDPSRARPRWGDPGFVSMLDQLRALGYAEGYARGILQGMARLVARMVQIRLGAAAATYVDRLASASLGTLETLADRLADRAFDDDDLVAALEKLLAD